ncbi:nuclear transport factor 2 family protein [Ralstonia soli]|uniref:Nuclear transport factor 2 family protein n=1 Tax=Ralstonia soli TaxID=2953896 RepID=A0ABT1AI72_9RALS|nr:nuclear transport factor 2 family protein [Ralstonia soli]MCO5397802.1 nuclear transport factor 2 family protein [Ralstonia soli]
MTDDSANLQRLADQLAIQDLMARYARHVDRRQWTALREIYHPDATDDHGGYVGPIDGFIEWVSRRHEAVDESMHFLGNCLVEFGNNDTALVETYFCAYLRLGPQAGSENAMLSSSTGAGTHGRDVAVRGRYVDRVERRNGVWRIAKRVTVFEAVDSKPADGPRPNPDHQWSIRSRADAVYAMRDEIFDVP